MNKKAFTYKKSGVNIGAADKFVSFISSISSKKEATKSLIILVDLAPFLTFPKTLKDLKSWLALMVLEPRSK